MKGKRAHPTLIKSVSLQPLHWERYGHSNVTMNDKKPRCNSERDKPPPNITINPVSFLCVIMLLRQPDASCAAVSTQKDPDGNELTYSDDTKSNEPLDQKHVLERYVCLSQILYCVLYLQNFVCSILIINLVQLLAFRRPPLAM